MQISIENSETCCEKMEKRRLGYLNIRVLVIYWNYNRNQVNSRRRPGVSVCPLPHAYRCVPLLSWRATAVAAAALVCAPKIHT